MTELTAPDQASTKVCGRCEMTKPAAAFAVTRRGRRGSTCSECRNESRRARGEHSRRRAAETPTERRKRQLWQMYKLTEEQYQVLRDAQGGACAICRREPQIGKPLVVDHCHATGNIRALLCSPCNLMIGAYELNHRAAAHYLATYGHGNPLIKP